MSKEQIEEMAKVLTKYERSLCERLPKDKCLLTSAIHSQVSCDYCKIAEFLYNAGYRKQSVGEWKWMHGCAGYGIYCTNCQAGWGDSEMVELIAHSHDFCPKCGAKMHKDKVDPLGDYKPVGNVKIIKKFVAKGGAE